MTQAIRIELPTMFPMKTVNAWLFKDPEPVLIDCGEKTEETWQALVNGLKENGLAIDDLSKVVITHGHLDHMGLAARIAENSQAKIWMPEYLYDWAVDLKRMLEYRADVFWEAVNTNLRKLEFQGKVKFGYDELSPFWDEIPADKIETFPMEGIFQMGGFEWEIIHTPGHCINQVCFYQKEMEWLLSADMVLKMTPIPILDPQIKNPKLRTKSLSMLVDSYKKLLKYSIKMTFPGHYEAFDNGSELMAGQLARIQAKKEKCFEAIQAGVSDFQALQKIIYPKRNDSAIFFMMIGFLDLLLDEDRIASKTENGIFEYFEKTLVH